MKKGDIWWAKLPLPIGRRRIVLLSRNEAYAIRNAITVVEVASTIRGIPVEVVLEPDLGLPKKCITNLDRIIIRKGLLVKKLTHLDDSKIEEINMVIKFVHDID